MNLALLSDVYRCLDWSYPLHGGGYNAAGKLLLLNIFIAIPLTNYVYWLLLWARRRVMLLASNDPRSDTTLDSSSASRKQGNPSDGASGGDGGLRLRPRRRLWEWDADYNDLRLDGRHWRAQFGGASSPTAPKVGAYVLCGSSLFAFTRLVLCMLSAILLGLRGYEMHRYIASSATAWTFFLYLDNWTLVLSLLYFTIVACITTYAANADGKESKRAPPAVWVAWILHGSACTTAIQSLAPLPLPPPYLLRPVPLLPPWHPRPCLLLPSRASAYPRVTRVILHPARCGSLQA